MSSPHGTKGYKLSYQIEPKSFSWSRDRVSVYFEANYAHWHTNFFSTSRNYDAVGLAPFLRLSPVSFAEFKPYFELSVGAVLGSSDHFGKNDLGSNLNFQDTIGIGAILGKQQRFFAAARFFHYSNAGLAPPNTGITIPFLVTVGYLF